MTGSSSPYTEHNHRLADVIAAIQVMGTYKYYKLDFFRWADRISGDENTADHWKQVVVQHPEFFRLDTTGEKASLVWRRQHQKLYHVDREEKISREEFFALSPDEKRRVSRTPLTSEELATLIQTAIDLHSRAVAHKKESRWWTSPVFGLAGVALGALLNAYVP